MDLYRELRLGQFAWARYEVGPANASNMVKFTTPNVSAPFTLALGANHYRFVGMEITSNSSQGCNLQNDPPVNCFTYSLISPVSTSTPLVDSITVDRCYIHGSPTQDVREALSRMAPTSR